MKPFPTFALLAAFLLATPSQGAAPVPATPQAPPLKGCNCVYGGDCLCGFGCDCSLSYGEAYRASIRTGQPLAVWVGQPARKTVGFVTTSVPTYEGSSTPRVVVGHPRGDVLIEVAVANHVPGADWFASMRRNSADYATRPPQPVYSVPTFAPAFGGAACVGGSCSRR